MRSPDRRSVAPVPGDEPGVTASRLFLAPLVLALLLGVVSLFAPDADAAPQRDARSARTYNVIRTFEEVDVPAGFLTTAASVTPAV